MPSTAVEVPVHSYQHLLTRSTLAWPADRHVHEPVVSIHPHTPKYVSGHVRTTAGAPIADATVLLFDQETDALVARTTTNPQGAYSFVRKYSDVRNYYTVSFTGTAGSLHGTSDRGLRAT